MTFSMKAPRANPEANPLAQDTISQKIEFIRSHFYKIEEIFKAEFLELKNLDLQEQERTKDHEDDSNYYYGYSDSLRDIEFVNLRMHRYTTLLTLYSYLEDTLNQICDKRKNDLGIETRYKDQRGAGIKRAKVYLRQMGEVDFDRINKEWEELTKLNALRNCIMHGNGDPYYDIHKDSNFKKVLDTYKYYESIDEKFVYFTSEYVVFIITVVERFLLHIIKN